MGCRVTHRTGGSRSHSVPSGHQRRARGCALGLDIEVGKAHALCRERIDARRGRPPNDPTAVNAKIPVTEVIAQHKHHIGLIACSQ